MNEQRVMRIPRLGWAAFAALVAAISGAVGFYGGWKTSIQASAIRDEQINRLIMEHPGLMARQATDAQTNIVQDNDISNLKVSVAALVVKMDHLTDLLIEDRQERRGLGK